MKILVYKDILTFGIHIHDIKAVSVHILQIHIDNISSKPNQYFF
jgi:hypothetical protein